MNDNLIYIDNKAYRKGYTTGTCAAAATKAALMMALNQCEINQVQITTPSGAVLDLDVLEANFSSQEASAAIRKDGGDDVDVTHGMLIFSRVTLNKSGVITIDGGEGIGRVTRKGIRHQIGSAAINATPLKMIEVEVKALIGDLGADILISAPEGLARAKETYNPRLGIIGGISILGTTGIVTPMSDDSWKQSITLEIEMKREAGESSLILVPGNYGESFAKQLNFPAHKVVVISNFIRHALKDAERLCYTKILLMGHFGKLVKVAAGVFNTHSHVADARMETIITHLALMGAPQPLLAEIYACRTTEEASEIINQTEYTMLYTIIAKKIKERMELLSKFSDHPLQGESILHSMDGAILGSSLPLERLQEEFY